VSPSVAEDYLKRLRRKRRAGTVRDAARKGAGRVAELADRPRRGAKRLVTGIIGQLPHYARLLTGLMTDPRVARLDKALVGLALAYLLLPTDFIADFVPFLGQVDDVYLLMLALQRLVSHAGPRVLRAHWTGDRRHLRELDIAGVVNAAAFFLPGRLRRNLKGLMAR
jgi:uncharacterized membrane protein YkvA (DUF1232 family)